MIGQTLDHYQIVERIGAGGMGVVYRARDERLKRDVAIKVLPAGVLTDASARKRFRQEALTLSKLNHPHIAVVHDFFTADDTDFLVMEYLSGMSLSEKLREGGALPESEVIRLGIQIAEALEEAHEQGVVHRDLKPGNIMVTPKGHAKVLDFGLAKLLKPIDEDVSTDIKSHGAVRGTLPYMSPEQVRGEPVGAASDIYAAGAVLFEMITGQRPYPETQTGKLIDAILNKNPLKPSEIRGLVSGELERIILKAMEKEPLRRPRSAKDLAEELRKLTLPSITVETVRAQRSMRRWRWTAGLAVATGLALALGALVTGRLIGSRSSSSARAELADSPVVAVLPLANVSGDESIDHLGLGIAHSLITSLSSLPSLTMVSPSATLTAIDGDPAGIAHELGASFVVTGSIQRAGDALQLTLNLVRPDNSVAWGGATEGAMSDLFGLQRRMAQTLSEALQLILTDADRKRLSTPPTRSNEAFGDYTQARSFLERPDVSGNLERAITLFQAALEKDPSFALAHAGLGEACWETYDQTREVRWTERAREATVEALRLDPDQAAVRYSMAVIYHGTGRIEKATDELERALVLQPRNDDAHRLLGEILADAGKIDDALIEFEKAIAIRPNFWGNHRALGLALLKVGRNQEAASALRRVTELQPDLSWGFNYLGAAYHMAGNLDEAVKNYEEAIRLGGSAGSYSNLGTIYYRRGNYAEAVRMYQHALELGERPVRYRNLGDAHAKLGRAAEARESFLKAKQMTLDSLEVNPADAEAMGALAVYEAKLQQWEEAKLHVAEAERLSPNGGEVLYRKAVVHALAGEAPEALKALSRALEAGFSASEADEDEDFSSLRHLEAFRILLDEHR